MCFTSAVQSCVEKPSNPETLQTARLQLHPDLVRSITSHTNKYCTYTVLRYIRRYFSGYDMDAVIVINYALSYSLTAVFQVDDF